MRAIVPDVRGRADEHGDLVRVAARRLGGRAHPRERPAEDLRLGHLEHEAVGAAAHELERLRPVAGHPHLETPVPHPRDPDLPARRARDRAPLRQLADDVDRPLGLGERRGRLAQDPAGGVAAPDGADGAVAEHVVERREHRCGDARIPRGGVRHERPHHHALRRGQDLGVDDVRLLPQDVGVERPRVGEAEALGALEQLDQAAGGRVRLQRQAEVHGASSVGVLRARPARPRSGCGGSARAARARTAPGPGRRCPRPWCG